jgi:hypothetical protein
VIYFQKRNAAKEIQPSRYSSMMRRDLNLEEYERYLKVLGKDIGPRTPDQPGNIEAAQSFIQSTLGYDNMGYDVVRRVLGDAVAFEASLPAKDTPGNLVLVCARYDGIHAESIATLFVLAHALTGSSHRNNIRFLAFEGSDRIPYSDWNPKEKFDHMTTLSVGIPGVDPAHFGGEAVSLSAPAADDPSALDVLKQDQETIERIGNAPR